MPDIFDVSPMQKYMALYVGPSGGGKSIAIASFMELGSVYFFDFDGRMASVANWYKQRGLKEGQLQYDTYGPHNLFDAMVKLDNFLTNCPHAVVVIDSFTAVTITAVTFQLKRRSGKGGTNAPMMSKGDMIIPDWDEYKGETVCVTQMLDLSKSLASRGIKVFWTAHPISQVKISKDEGGKDKYAKQTRYAAYGQKSDSLIPIYFDEIYHFTTEYSYSDSSNKRLCFTQPNGDVGAKTALNLPPVMDWTDKNFYKVFMESLK